MLQFSHKGLAGVCWPSFWVMMGHAHQSVFAEILPETAASWIVAVPFVRRQVCTWICWTYLDENRMFQIHPDPWRPETSFFSWFRIMKAASFVFPADCSLYFLFAHHHCTSLCPFSHEDPWSVPFPFRFLFSYPSYLLVLPSVSRTGWSCERQLAPGRASQDCYRIAKRTARREKWGKNKEIWKNSERTSFWFMLIHFLQTLLIFIHFLGFALLSFGLKILFYILPWWSTWRAQHQGKLWLAFAAPFSLMGHNFSSTSAGTD